MSRLTDPRDATMYYDGIVFQAPPGTDAVKTEPRTDLGGSENQWQPIFPGADDDDLRIGRFRQVDEVSDATAAKVNTSTAPEGNSWPRPPS
jgi:hypothetical protein